MSRPVPTYVYHFTHIDHVETIVSEGLLADSQVGTLLQREAGMPAIKDQRSAASVPVHPGGVVADYVPFYFASRSPMMYSIRGGNVPSFGTDLSSLVYLVTSVERLLDLQLRPVFTCRNAALATADFFNDPDQLDSKIDWDLMQAQYWSNTPDDQDRVARRMAECLVPTQVPWDAFEGVAACSATLATALSHRLASLNKPIPVRARPGWYF